MNKDNWSSKEIPKYRERLGDYKRTNRTLMLLN